jgi:hypothetical protein
MTKHLRAIVGLFAFLTCLVFCARSANSAVNLSRSPNTVSWFPRIDIDAQGNIYVVWLEMYSDTSGDIFFSKYTKSSQQWSTPQNISNSGNVGSFSRLICAIDIDGSQRVYAAWGERNGLRVRILTGDSWGPVIQAAQFNIPDSVRMQVDDNGNIYIIWHNDGGGTVYSTARVDGYWESVRSINSTGRRAKAADIAVGKGVVYGVWAEKTADGSRYQAVWTRRGKAFNASWTPSGEIYYESNSHQHPAVEMDSDDNPHVVWTPVFEPYGNRSVYYSYWTGSGFNSPKALCDVTMLHWPSIAVKDNKFYVCWQVGGSDNGQAVNFSSGQKNSWTDPASVPDSGGCALCDLAVDPQGKINVVWNNNPDGEIYFYSGSSGGGQPKPNQPPVAEFSFSPTTGLAPLEVSFDASASYDTDGMIVQYDWIFGDGTTGSGKTARHTFQRKGTYSVKLTVVDDRGAIASKVKTIETLGLFAPLNVHWQTFVDESLFLTRYITEVYWDKNPANDAIAVIVKYRIYRKDADDADAVFQPYAEVDGNTYNYRDSKVKGKDQLLYAVTALDGLGHESPLQNDAWADDSSPEARRIIQRFQSPKKFN